jgi:hypothetical protein
MSGKPYNALRYDMVNNSSIAEKVGRRVWHGLQPQRSTVPSITFFEDPLIRTHGLETQSYVINCRDKTPAGALELARLVIDLFHGSLSGGTYGTVNNFDIARSFLDTASGVVPEGSSVYNAPVIITLVYASSTVS